MDIEIVRQNRKTLAMRLSEDRLVVKAPLKLSEQKIQEFISSKRNWIEKHLAIEEKNKTIEKSFDFDNIIYKFGESYMKTEEIAIHFDKLSVEKKYKCIKKQYMSMFEILRKRAIELADKFNIKVNKISPMTSKRMWGQFNSKSEMRLNFKLVIVPQELVDYVIIHELCHSLHMNHKPKFWAEVEKFCPNYKSLRKQLSALAFVLKSTNF